MLVLCTVILRLQQGPAYLWEEGRHGSQSMGTDKQIVGHRGVLDPKPLDEALILHRDIKKCFPERCLEWPRVRIHSAKERTGGQRGPEVYQTRGGSDPTSWSL